ncbi:maleylpyruvate isomerase family mycothiol-dependent enzyme [Amycolatopsis aidingensis]|uniref:maleylpyruvate isomerase family mycothiol-dependent enzyme n=1 Tax=Amycolatopsis aidingensis TaxID=2842453 RepID=UPI001C0CC3F5|nr:maleylpyruvate isomerase family mycothiol-dependent enzyme [Amycolatopsis aidingensis]
MNQPCHALDHESYCARVAMEIGRVAERVGTIDADTPVPTCPQWTARDVATHLGMIHRWVDRTVRDQATEPVEFTQFGRDVPAEWAGFGDWLGRMAAPLPDTLRSADPEGPAWSFTDNQRANFWPRRMLHETMVHRIDLDIAAGVQPSGDPDSAVDGIDELLYLLPFGHPFRDGPPDLRGTGETVHLHATDAGVHWLIRLGPHGHTWEHLHADPPEPAMATVRGRAVDLHRFQYNRAGAEPGVERTGSPEILTDWLTRSAL